MIFCTLDDKVAYPSTSDKIKVTYENQFIKDSGSYTYDITFPMAVAANRRIFGNVQRMDVKKAVPDFETCRLYVSNRLIISGKGTVTSITPEKVKVQIVGGKSRIKYNSNFEKHYIDEIDYPDVVPDTGLDDDLNKWLFSTTSPTVGTDAKVLFIDLTKNSFVGQKGVAVFSPAMDETSNLIANRLSVTQLTPYTGRGGSAPADWGSLMVNLAPQPYLMYILRKVMDYEGYTIERNDIDVSPWNRLVIVSACKTCKVKDALPHWTVYKFIDELRKLFNASFIFDEVRRTVSITATNELLSNDTVSYDCEDDFSVEHDDDGLDNLATSNIEYSFDSSANRDWREYIPAKVLNSFPVKEYSSKSAMVDAAEAMTKRERFTTIFKVGFTYYIWAYRGKNGNPDATETYEQCTLCGMFNPVVRDASSDDFQELAMFPAAVFQTVNYGSEDKHNFMEHKNAAKDEYIVLPSVFNDKEVKYSDMQEDDDGEYYTSVQDAIESGDTSASDDSEDDNTGMPLAFVAANVLNIKSQAAVNADQKLDGEDKLHRVPMLFTDFRMFPDLILNSDSATLSLEYQPNKYWGTGGKTGTRTVSLGSRYGNVEIDKNNVVTIKFITDDIPDPSHIYLFHNKRYICQKVEMNVADDGIDREKTGYFYEIN